jgi:hypothetical protein
MKTLKSLSVLLTTLLVYLLQLPFSIAKSASALNVFNPHARAFSHPNSDPFIDNTDTKSVYDSIHLDLAGLNRKAFELAKTGLLKLKNLGKITNDSILSIIDFSQPSTQKRLYILDLKNYTIRFNTYVAHGRNSGMVLAHSFSNRPHSYQSSLGFYITEEPYEGHNGYSLKLAGMEPGINDKAETRGIVVHGAKYVNSEMITETGRIGRSEGCPAVPTNEATPLINYIKDGTCLFIYYPDPSYSRQSALLN